VEEIDHKCPHCGEKLDCWEPPPEGGWSHNVFLCMNNACSYFIKGRKKISGDYEANFGCRYCYDPVKGKGISMAAWCGGELSLLKGRCKS
jgi:hypothetical protein